MNELKVPEVRSLQKGGVTLLHLFPCRLRRRGPEQVDPTHRLRREPDRLLCLAGLRGTGPAVDSKRRVVIPSDAGKDVVTRPAGSQAILRIAVTAERPLGHLFVDGLGESIHPFAGEPQDCLLEPACVLLCNGHLNLGSFRG